MIGIGCVMCNVCGEICVNTTRVFGYSMLEVLNLTRCDFSESSAGCVTAMPLLSLGGSAIFRRRLPPACLCHKFLWIGHKRRVYNIDAHHLLR